jgi:hypothetical protein
MTPDNHAYDNAELRASTIAAVRYVVKLKLPRARWELVAEIIKAAVAPAAAGNWERLRQATGELMLISPVRILKGDEQPIESADQRIFERTNVLIDSLQSMRPAAPDETDGTGR